MKKEINKHIVILITILLYITSAFISRIHAQDIQAIPSSLKIYPVIIPVDLRPNTTTTQEITLENLTSAPSPLRANFSDFTSTGEDGGYSFSDKASNPLLAWSSITPQEIIIPAKSKMNVRLTIHTPGKIPVGGYFGMIFFEPVTSQTNNQTTKVIPRIGVLLLGSLGVQNAQNNPINIETLSLPFLVDSNTLPFLLRTKNYGLQYLTVKPIITFSSWSKSSSKIILEDKVVFPGKIRRWEETIKIPDFHMFTIYSVKVSLAQGQGRTKDEYRTVIVFPYKQTIILITLVGLFIFIFTKRKNVKRALSVLFYSKGNSS